MGFNCSLEQRRYKWFGLGFFGRDCGIRLKMLYEVRLEGEREWKLICAFMEWDKAALESKGDSLMHFISDPVNYKRGGQPTQTALARVERGGLALLRICPSSLCAPQPSCSPVAPRARALATDITLWLLGLCCQGLPAKLRSWGLHGNVLLPSHRPSVQATEITP